jgi:hypothetical protein
MTLIQYKIIAAGLALIFTAMYLIYRRIKTGRWLVS